MIKKEAKFGILLRHWIKANKKSLISCGIEIKDSRGKDYIPFTEIKESQLVYGEAIKSDEGVLIRTQGGNGEPDYIFLRNSPAYIIIKFPKSFSIIDVDNLHREKKASKRKSLTSLRARDISIKTISLA